MSFWQERIDRTLSPIEKKIEQELAEREIAPTDKEWGNYLHLLVCHEKMKVYFEATIPTPKQLALQSCNARIKTWQAKYGIQQTFLEPELILD